MEGRRFHPYREAKTCSVNSAYKISKIFLTVGVETIWLHGFINLVKSNFYAYFCLV